MSFFGNRVETMQRGPKSFDTSDPLNELCFGLPRCILGRSPPPPTPPPTSTGPNHPTPAWGTDPFENKKRTKNTGNIPHTSRKPTGTLEPSLKAAPNHRPEPISGPFDPKTLSAGLKNQNKPKQTKKFWAYRPPKRFQLVKKKTKNKTTER